MDAVVLLGGCDKTLPAQLMASASASVPAIHLVTGPMLAGDWHGERLGACTDCRRYWAQHRAGALDAKEIAAVRQSLCPTAGTCMVMGTASTMACVAEALGLMLPGAATPPAVSSQRLRLGVATGRRAVALATEGRSARDILTPPAFANALKVLAALSGSTNAVVHLLAIARRVWRGPVIRRLSHGSPTSAAAGRLQASGQRVYGGFRQSRRRTRPAQSTGANARSSMQ